MRGMALDSERTPLSYGRGVRGEGFARETWPAPSALIRWAIGRSPERPMADGLWPTTFSPREKGGRSPPAFHVVTLRAAGAARANGAASPYRPARTSSP